MRYQTVTFAALAFALIALVPVAGNAASSYIYSKRNNLAVDGYDPVTYFSVGEATKGSADHELNWNGRTWRFASAENRSTFESDPEQYAPQYGGWCAWAASGGYLARGNPNHWKIVDGKLYLNYSGGVQRKWEKDIPGHIEKADGNWPGLMAEAAAK